MSEAAKRSPAGAVALGASATVVCLLPVFLTAALAVPLGRDLGFGVVVLGVSVALYRTVAAVSSPFLGRLADMLGASNSIRLATAVAAVTSIGIAVTADRTEILMGWLVLGGCSAALVQPAANRLLANVVPGQRLGTAFGIKQSAPPAASMLAGLSLPVVALTFGWRWAYALAALAAVTVGISAGRQLPTARGLARRWRAESPNGEKLVNTRVIVVLAVAFGLGTSTSSALTTFYVDASFEQGSSEQFAGITLALASAAAIAVRVVCGLVSDSVHHGHLRLCAGLLMLGAIGTVLLALGDPVAMAFGGIVALGGSWGFNGVFIYAMVRGNPGAPGRITGAVAPGALIGASVGPLLFGVVAGSVGYWIAWLLTGGLALIAGAAMMFGDRLMGSSSQATA